MGICMYICVLYGVWTLLLLAHGPQNTIFSDKLSTRSIVLFQKQEVSKAHAV